MTYTSLIVHVEANSSSSDARVELAASLASRHGALLIGVAAGAPMPPPVDAYGGIAVVGDLFEAEEEQIRQDLTAAGERFRTITAPHRIEVKWRSAIDLPVEVLSREAGSADLIVIGRDLSRTQAGIYRSADPGDVLLRAGRPVLVVPPGSDSLRAESVLVAWKDTREARRAIFDALPGLKMAQSVMLLEVATESDINAVTARADLIGAWLDRHGIKAKVEVRTQRERSVADELILVADQINADLIVSGGYGHARLREWVFGGVTRELLQHSPKCCLFSH